jgi:ABC-2 type transport system ATP-binding protein
MPAIVVNNLSKKFKSFAAVDGLSFNVTENHVVGFLGPNGAGKTTTLRMLVGLSKPTGGDITISGIPVVFGNSAANKKIGYLPELPSMYSWMSGYEYLNFVADILKLDKNVKEAKIAELLKTVDLTEAQHKRIATYSSGMKQRLGIAQALINDPDVIIMDEPVSALDPIGRKNVLHVIEKLKKNRTILLSTHILSDVDKICDDVVMINKGKLVVSSPLAELKEKYASPILEIEFISDPRGILEKVQKEKWVKRIEQDNALMRIWLTDNSVVEKNIPLKFFAGQNIGILKYGLTLPETEDLFVELLGAKNE